MIKVTERGIEELGEEIELSQEDREFIRDMFEKNSKAGLPEYGYSIFEPEDSDVSDW